MLGGGNSLCHVYLGAVHRLQEKCCSRVERSQPLQNRLGKASTAK